MKAKLIFLILLIVLAIVLTFNIPVSSPFDTMIDYYDEEVTEGPVINQDGTQVPVDEVVEKAEEDSEVVVCPDCQSDYEDEER